MNRAVVRRTAAGLAAYLRADGGPAGAGGHRLRRPARQRDDFARDSAAVLAGAGLRRRRCCPGRCRPRCWRYAVRLLGAAAGVMVTASHNPPEDNGYKVYDRDRCADRAAGRRGDRGRDRRGRSAVGRCRCRDRYAGARRRGAGVLPGRRSRPSPRTPHRALRTVHTALHGVGAGVLRAAFARAGFPPPVEVDEQADAGPGLPDGRLPEPGGAGRARPGVALAARGGRRPADRQRPGRRPVRGRRADAGRLAGADRRRARRAARRPPDPHRPVRHVRDDDRVLLAARHVVRGARARRRRRR